MAWQMGLLAAIKDSSQSIIRSNLAVVIKDKYPKAKHHYLVIPLEDIPSIFKLQRKHLPLLEELELLAKNVIEITGCPDDQFRIGYHAKPSMRQLHLHVISRDFCSEFLKTKKHFNSFTTEFFIEARLVREELDRDGRVSQWGEQKLKELIGQEMQCCGKTFANMTKLKDHIHRGHR